MDEAEQKNRAEKFVKRWLAAKGREDAEMNTFWIELIREVLGADDKDAFPINFQDPVEAEGSRKMDVVLPVTHVLIEHKTRKPKTLLARRGDQSGGKKLTPFQQAKRYDDGRLQKDKAQWIVTCDFDQFWVYDMNNPKQNSGKEHVAILLKDLPDQLYRLKFLVGEPPHVEKEEDVSVKAGKIVRRIYDSLRKSEGAVAGKGKRLTADTLLSLNVFCVRLVFCLYAENANLFTGWGAFHDYLVQYPANRMRQAFDDLFKILEADGDARKQDDIKRLIIDDPNLDHFQYVNGGLFKNKIKIPSIDNATRDTILKEASSKFNWNKISPTIFGAIFESTLNEETRKKGGMHYTTPENIQKVIRPLFLDDLNEEFEKISEEFRGRDLAEKLESFQEKLASLKFLDPACGSGNFLTETFRLIRELENKAILLRAENSEIEGNPIKVSIDQFYGIEINDFAVAVAKTAMWIADCQMLAKLKDELAKLKTPKGQKIAKISKSFLPLRTCANIVEGNALNENMDWERLEVEEGLFPRKLQKGEVREPREAVTYDYIFGNPPFSGGMKMSDRQKAELKKVASKSVKGIGELDYVAGWFFKAAKLVQGKTTRVAFVATNSITQGESVAPLWGTVLPQGIHIDFAYRTFQWDSESDDVAHVHCVIVGFSSAPNEKPRVIFDGKEKIIARNINGYLMDMATEKEALIVIPNSTTPVSKGVPKMIFGNMPRDGKNYIIKADEYDNFLKKNPVTKKRLVREYLGAKEFINGKKRWCLWLEGATPQELALPEIKERVDKVRKFRLRPGSPKETRKFAVDGLVELFVQRTQPLDKDFLLVPATSSKNRKYVPMGFLEAGIVCSNATQIIPNATHYHFGILTSDIHMAWIRAVGGRLKSDYRYSGDLVYNNFPWEKATARQIEKIKKTAKGILAVRKMYQKQGWTLEDLYRENKDENEREGSKPKRSNKRPARTMPKELRKAHEANDKAVRELFGFQGDTEEEIVKKLFKKYLEQVKARYEFS